MPKFGYFSFCRDLHFLAAKNPYWGAGKLGEEVHMKLLQAQLSLPPGAVFQVWTTQITLH